MAIRKTIEIDGNPVEFKASALTPYQYKEMFGRDFLLDMQKVTQEVEGQDENASMISAEALRVFADAAYVMYMAAHPDEKYASADEWLDQFSMFSIYQILPELTDLWKINIKTTVPARKN
jgi:hypothetical protein